MAANDAFLLEDKRHERIYQRRKSRFLTLQQHHDVSKERVFIISDDKPWQVFRNGYTTHGKLQRRKFIFEHTRSFPALHQACITGDRNQVRALMNTPEVCVLERDNCGRIALHHAVINENFKIIKDLLRRRDAKLQVHVRDNSSRTALHYALEKMELLALHRSGGLRVPPLITVKMREENKRYRRLWEISDRILEMFCRKALEGGWGFDGDGGESIRRLDMRCRGDLWDVCRSGDLHRLEMIVKIYGCSEDEWELSELRWTLLHEACENQQLQLVFFFISTMGMSVLTQDTSGCTALHCAARRGYLDVCQMLLRKDCGDELNENAEELILLPDVRGRTALHWCLLGFCGPIAMLQIAVFLARSCSSALHVYDQEGISPLHLAIWRGELKLVQEFICLGANVCAPTACITQPQRGENVEKASWAPCGIIFQHRRRRRKKSEEVAPTIADADKPSGLPSIPAVSEKSTPDWENMRHPIEGLWYWAQVARDKEKVTEIKKDKHRDSEPVITEEELGCRKYGGICHRCKLPSIDSTETTSTTSDAYHCHFRSPLLLALRLCAVKRSMLDHRVTIVELLLSSGAPPDKMYDDDFVNDQAKETNSHDPSALSEGIRVSLHCSHIIPMLVQYGAEKISTSSILRWCSSVRLADAKQFEAVLFQLLDLEIIARSSDDLAILFCLKYFRVLRDLVKRWLQHSTPNAYAATVSDGGHDFFRGDPPWKSIQETLVSWGKRRNIYGADKAIGTQHLEFLYGVVLSDHDHADVDHDIWELFEYCVDIYLRQRRNGYDSNSDFKPKEDGVSVDRNEQILLLSIQTVFNHWKHDDAADQRVKSKAAIWLESSIVRGYYDCAIVILEKLHRMGDSIILLDKIFEYSSSTGDELRYSGDSQLQFQREFLLVCTENMLKVNASCIDAAKAQSNTPQPTAVASVRSIVHMCANNLPFILIKRCFDAALPEHLTDSSPDIANEFTTMKTMRVRGKTMAQWVVVNARSDILQWLLMRLSPGMERGQWWGEFVAACPVITSDGSKSSSSFIDNLFSIYMEHVHKHLAARERGDLIVRLVVKYAIPTDSVTLLQRLIKCMGSSGSDCSVEHLASSLNQPGVLHAIARWNAVQIADFCLSERCPRDGFNWQQSFVKESQVRHEIDECTPLELCQFLGHKRLYSLLFSRLQQSSLPQTKIDNDRDTVETDEFASRDSIDMEEESTTDWKVGLLRSIIDINERLSMAQGGVVESFKGYKRSPTVQDPWVSAVSLDQVSHLHAMALTRSLCSDSDASVRSLVLTAIKNASLNALKWILKAGAPVSSHLSDDESVECLCAAAKHPGDVHAEMTLLLLENKFNPGRLSGDGMGIPLLHRAACFTNTTLACRIMMMLLERSDCDVNTLDAFGNTALSYALAAGCLRNACFLIINPKCRLEAEYEGQSCFYYVLHIAPSFASRSIVLELLVSKRDRAFLHCDADSRTCGCKGYERQGEDGDGALCGFCGHEYSNHRVVPLPSWIRDQYDTYVAAINSPRKHSHSSCSEDDDSETSQHCPTDAEDEEIVLENSRGRLDVALLRQITALRFDDILQANGLRLPVEDDTRGSVVIAFGGDNDRPAWQVSTEPASEVVPDYVTMQELPIATDIYADESVNSNGGVCRGAKSNRTAADCPWWLRQELAKVHSPRCLCQSYAFVTSRTQLAHVAVCRWLRRTAILHMNLSAFCSPCVTESAIIALASVQPAFEHWRDVARLDRSKAVPKPLPSILRSVLFHWRHGKEFLAFQRWKHHLTSAEVSHHRLATRLELVAADMRRNRFLTLQLRQQQLQDSTRSLLP